MIFQLAGEFSNLKTRKIAMFPRPKLFKIKRIQNLVILKIHRLENLSYSESPENSKLRTFPNLYVINRRKAISHSYTNFPTFSIICVRCEIYCSMLEKFSSPIVGRFILCLNVRTHACVSHVQSMLIRN